MYDPDTDGNLSYPKTKGSERYVKDAADRDVYISAAGHETYAFNFSRKREIYGMDNNNIEFYAKRDGSEVYAVDLRQRFETFISPDLYAKDSAENEVYPKTPSRRDKVAKRDGVYVYARLANGDQFYPRDDSGDDYVHYQDKKVTIAKTADGSPVAPRFSDGRVKYDVRIGRECLWESEGIPFFARDSLGNQIYPKDEFLSEYYPGSSIAKDRFGRQRYAVDSNGKIVYPKNGKGEYYYLTEDQEDTFEILERQSRHFDKYIDSTYPKRRTKHGLVEVLMDDRYEKVYPRDSLNNEYCNRSGDLIESLGYPVTNDGLVIIPNVENEPRGDEETKKNIYRLMYRPDFDSYDFLTSVRTDRISLPKTEYQTLDVPRPENSSLVAFALALMFLILVLLTIF